ncbi:sensor domain-containing diguanylate cyclase [Trinickia terrae]|uniref:diguanylate cyclase n=1 Tax=Trinickia terrae TaxID=2571161 RepID=A0A4U1HI23_9BURK|nr:sensor domain-containing diguanylate cyclase [Trinickia terrae]TKC78954.1 sensor domain-containing diguanylate cyclase [Trinickia terrae]
MTDDSQKRLSEQLRVLVQTVQQNERTLRRFQDVELALIGAQDFASFLDILFVRLPQEFRLHSVRLWADQTCALLGDLLTSDAEPGSPRTGLLVDEAARDAGAQLCADGAPWLGRTDDSAERRLAAFFGDAPPKSAIVLPLMLPLTQHGATLGYLCLASSDPARFAPGMATDILERFASIVTASLDNVAHRERLKRLGMTDALTGLANRRHFDERLREEVMRAARHGMPVACLFADIDHFKRINDTHGHAAGDRALIAAGGCVRNQLRGTDILARYGGEEFAALLVQTDLAGARIVAERIRDAVAGLEVLDERGERIALTLSLGIAVRTIDAGRDAAEAAHELIEDADQAMYRAKRNGRDRVEEAG